MKEVDKHPGSCDEVWFASCFGYPKKEEHRKLALELFERAKKVRAHGLRVSLQISNTPGHGQYASANDCSGLVYEGSKVGNMVSYDGTANPYVFCYNDPVFTEYITSTAAEHAILDPEVVRLTTTSVSIGIIPSCAAVSAIRVSENSTGGSDIGTTVKPSCTRSSEIPPSAGNTLRS